jgi:hypothetical protein
MVFRPNEMRAFLRMLGRVFFWNFERGTVPYDLIVLAVVLFVFLTPRRWFHDQPDEGAPVPPATIPCEQDANAPGLLRCRVNASLLAPKQHSPELEEKAHNVLRDNSAELKDRTFQVVRIEPVLGENGGVLYYEVSVKK